MKYILRIDSFTGDSGTDRTQKYNGEEVGRLYCIINLDERGGAEEPARPEIIDDGYSSFAEAQKAWPEAI